MGADVIIIGAGVAGLVAARDVREANLRPLVLEARARLGGRIWTHASGDQAIELGAEFIHGLPPALWSELKAAGLVAKEVDEGRSHLSDGTIKPFPEFWEIVEKIDGQISPEPEITYADFLRVANGSDFEKKVARSYVEGFNAARADRISAPAVAVADRAAEEIDGGKAFHLVGGYATLVDWLARGLADRDLLLEAVVTVIRWSADGVEVHCGERIFRASRV